MDSPQITRPGFTLAELLIAIALLGLIAAIVVPRVARGPQEERKQFITQLNGFTKFAWQNAITSGAVQKIDFDFEKRRVTLWQDTGKKNIEGKSEFLPVKKAYRSTTITMPRHLIIKNFFIEGFDEMKRVVGKTVGAYFYIVPDGLAQSVIINMIDTKDKTRAGRPKPVGLVLNPFWPQFKTYATFKQPQK